MRTMICPRCGQPIPPEAERKPLAHPEGCHPVVKVAHRKADGKWCAVVIAPVEDEGGRAN